MGPTSKDHDVRVEERSTPKSEHLGIYRGYNVNVLQKNLRKQGGVDIGAVQCDVLLESKRSVVLRYSQWTYKARMARARARIRKRTGC
jgi:hypothetical protein